jgi:leucyl-tRNA synthetase
MEAKVFEANPDPGKPKFFVTAAFPYPNSPLHLGHGRTYTIADVYARFKRMQGYNVLFPMGFHYTGTPILTMAEALAAGDLELEDLMVNVYDVPRQDLDKLKDPLGMARYFHADMKAGMIELGMSIDWRREFTTIDEEFRKFIEWQFTKLRERGYIVQGTHPVGWCPNHNMPVGMHDTKNDVEPEIGEYTLIMFKLKDSDVYLAAATLRPETVFGVTNVWLNPEASYVIVEVEGRKLLVSERAAFKLKFQRRSVNIVEKVDARKLLGRFVINPATGEEVPILPASFVDPDTATGVVMSVPAHAPYDYAALMDIARGRMYPEFSHIASKLAPIPLIRVEGYSEVPAKDVVEALGVESQRDRHKLDEATKKLYSDEYRYGIMREDIVERVYPTGGRESVFARAAVKAWIAGRKVPEAREATVKWLRALGFADTMYEVMNRPVYCRCGTEVVVKVLENQWFIDYGNEGWKKIVREALSSMRIVPEVMREEFLRTVDWLRMRAAARTRGLGTPLPWEKGWIIESLSDSTIYMAFYTVIHKIRGYGVPASKLTVEFWDYVMLGKGDPRELAGKLGVEPEQLEDLRREFEYWYPVDSRHSGRDLVQNHLTFYVFNHVAIFPRDKWPKQIVVNGFVKLEGKKMSKSLRNVIPLRRMLRVYGPDTVRASLIVAAEILQDADFTDALARSVLGQLERIYKLVRQVAESKAEKESQLASRWLLSRLQQRIKEVTNYMEELRLRHAAVVLLYEMVKDLEKYLELGGSLGSRTARIFVDSWVRMLAPIVPHVAEEMWSMLGGKGFVSVAEWPRPQEDLVDPEVELAVVYADMLIEDVKRIAEALGRKPERVVVAVAPPSDWRIARRMAEEVQARRSVKEAVRAVLSELDPGTRKRLAPSLPRLYERLVEVAERHPGILQRVEVFDEVKAVEMLRGYLEAKLGARIVAVRADSEEAAKLVPQSKLASVTPLRPAIQVQ